ncbi:UilS family quorum-quenching N-acyl-homoserine lactonase [Yersinia aldovae]|uniref:UilS family quorum-quenching N-acyl-homoserine lactonase n=1 Tax=Yersinia aldovae TaxID=29483 RepID=UPI0005AC5132|nr:alpha/beta fold hydrolase [Yersinia aldovae]AJJ61926.1 dienelactone hydrolase family protein [Yersinia aldovae 670-83]
MKAAIHQLPNGISLTLRTTEHQGNKPVVILCHGFCGIQEILLPAFAEAFTLAGFNTVTFDYRGFGSSLGERGRLVPAMQIEDILSVVAWVKTQADMNTSRIGLWGTSFGGCHVFGAAADNPDIACVVSQLAFADGEDIVTGKMSEEEKKSFIATLDKMVEKKQATGKETFVGVTRVLNDKESKTFFETNKIIYPAMDIKIPFLTVRETLRYKPKDNAARVTCPTLVVIAGADTVNPPDQGQELYNAVSSLHKTLHMEDGAMHYDMYSGKHFDNIIAIQTDWFRKHL